MYIKITGAGKRVGGWGRGNYNSFAKLQIQVLAFIFTSLEM